MRANNSDDDLYKNHFLGSKSNNDRDAISWTDVNVEQNSGLHYKNPNSNDNRRPATKQKTKTVSPYNDYDGNGLIVNGQLFDGQLFEPFRSSYIFDYKDSPKDFNRFITGYNMSLKPTNLDTHLFKLSFVITLSEWNVDKELLLYHYPHEDNKAFIMEEISNYKKFCFPEINSKLKNHGNVLYDSSTYIFTRTNSYGEVEYGYCRRIPSDNHHVTKFPIVICIVSTYSYFKLYDAILDELATVYESNELECSLLMQSFYSKPLPIPSPNASGIACKLNDHRVFFYVCPYDDRLNHDYFSTLLSCLSPNFIVHLFESMLRSKKILCYSKSISKLTKCCLALSNLLYPFLWPYPFVSIMPSSWVQDLLDSPCPYIYGCLYETIQQTPSIMEKDAVRVDLDANTVDIGLDDGFVLPLNLRQTFQASLEYITKFRLNKSTSDLINIAASEACLHVFTELFHRLPDFFKRDKTVNNIKRDDSGIDLQSVVSTDTQPESNKREENRLGYDFRSDEFLISQPTPPYVNFLNDFIHGMTFLKFLDDYQRVDGNSKQSFVLFTQRLNERRRMTMDQLAINPVIRFRQTFGLLEKQIKQSPKPTFSKFVKMLFE